MLAPFSASQLAELELLILRESLARIQQCDENREYKERNAQIYIALSYAQSCGFASGVRFDPREPEWPVAFIELPTGQVSWHLQQHENAWDGHTVEEKRERIDEFINGGE